MAIRTIRFSDDEILRKKSRKVDKVDDRIRAILDDMVETMYENEGLGLAAVQVGILRRLVTIDTGESLLKLVNPEIIETDGEELDVEGCLSVPGYQGNVLRPVKVTVKALDENGDELLIEAEGLLKKALCHEIDHLEGILYTDIAEDIYELNEEYYASLAAQEAEEEAAEGSENQDTESSVSEAETEDKSLKM